VTGYLLAYMNAVKDFTLALLITVFPSSFYFPTAEAMDQLLLDNALMLLPTMVQAGHYRDVIPQPPVSCLMAILPRSLD
jgi:hypothetical protein